MNLRPKSEPHSNLQNGLSNPLSLRKDITSLPLSCPFPSALPRWGQVAEPGLTLKKKQGPRILYSSLGVWLLRKVPTVCWRCSGRVSPGAISQGGCARHRPDRQNTPASSSSPSPVCVLFIVRDALSYHKQRALTITKGFSVLRAVYYYSINQYSSHHMVKHWLVSKDIIITNIFSEPNERGK